MGGSGGVGFGRTLTREGGYAPADRELTQIRARAEDVRGAAHLYDPVLHSSTRDPKPARRLVEGFEGASPVSAPRTGALEGRVGRQLQDVRALVQGVRRGALRPNMPVV